MADDSKRLRQTLEDVQGRARHLEQITDRYVDRIASLEAEVKALRARETARELEHAAHARKLTDSERAFEHTVARLADREQLVKAQLKRIRELEALLAQRSKELARAERRGK